MMQWKPVIQYLKFVILFWLGKLGNNFSGIQTCEKTWKFHEVVLRWSEILRFTPLIWFIVIYCNADVSKVNKFQQNNGQNFTLTSFILFLNRVSPHRNIQKRRSASPYFILSPLFLSKVQPPFYLDLFRTRT